MSNFRDIEISASTIKNGRIYLPAGEASFFPIDALGDRSRAGGHGKSVEIVAGDEAYLTDIRVSSGVRISPRRSFARFLKAVRAQRGDLLRLTRTSDRKYTLEYLGRKI